MTALIRNLPAGLPYVVQFSDGREVTYLWHQRTDTYTLAPSDGVELTLTPAEVAEGEEWLRSEAEAELELMDAYDHV